MIEAKDTVIDIAEDKYDGLGADTLVEIQAEISFKVGKTAGVAESLIPALKAIEESHKAGQRERAKWMKGKLNEITCMDDNTEINRAVTSLIFELKEWEVELKEEEICKRPQH